MARGAARVYTAMGVPMVMMTGGTMRKVLLLAGSLLLASTCARAGVVFLHEGFDNLAASGWTIVNASTPPGASGWFQGNPAIFPAADGAPDSYAAADFNARAAAGGTISVWLISPQIDFVSQALSFVARAADALHDDALNVMLSASGDSLNLADFGLLLAINPGNGTGGMPADWAPFLAGLPHTGSGRIAFEYTVGPNNLAGYVGVDSVDIAPPLCLAADVGCAPEPTSLPLAATALALAMASTAWRRRVRRH